MSSRIRLILFLILLSNPAVELRKLSAGGGRGSSSSRTQVASGGNNQQGGSRNKSSSINKNSVHPQQGGSHPNPQQSHFGQPSQNYNRGPSNFHPVPVAPKTSSNSFGKALLGGAAGALGAIVVYEGAKAIIKSATTPFNYGGRDYYWDQNNRVKHNEILCSKPLGQLQQEIAAEQKASTTTISPSNETTTVATATTPSITQIGNIQYQDGSRPKTISWTCARNQQVCCEMDCCPNPAFNQSSNAASHGSSVATILLIILLVILIGGCCCCIIAFMACRSAFDCIFPRDHHKQYEETMQNAEYTNQQQYPMQQYPQQNSYPQQQPFQPQYPNQYPPQHSYPNSYPAQPTY